MMESHKREKIKVCIMIGIIALIVIVSILIMIRYQVEGEKNMPFNVSKIVVVSSAEGVANSENPQAKWDLQVMQSNDIYFEITKNEEYKAENFLKSIKFENFNVYKKPLKGEIQEYMPNSLEGRLFVYSDDFKVKDSLTFKGDSKTDSKSLQIANQGGSICIRISNDNLGKYISEEDDEIKHDGTLITKTDAKKDDIEFSISFDMLLETKNTTYKTTINLDLPYGELLEQGTVEQKITDAGKLVFKRVKN